MTKLCVSCKVPLNGVLDTFGEPGEEMCQQCWLSLVEAMQPEPRFKIQRHEGVWRDTIERDLTRDAAEQRLQELRSQYRGLGIKLRIQKEYRK